MLSDTRIEFAATHLGHCRFFSRVAREQLVALATQMSEQRYPAKHLIFQEGDLGDDLYMVETGIVRITMDSRQGNQAILGEVHPCETFGELGVLDGAVLVEETTEVAFGFEARLLHVSRVKARTASRRAFGTYLPR